MLKISPDVEDEFIDNIIELVLQHNIDGVILTNTTNQNRDNLLDIKKNEIGGLSGKPIRNLSTELIKKFYKQLKGRIPIIGVGGVDSGKSTFEKLAAGASAIQLYTGMVYKGPTIVKEIKKELIQIMKQKGFKNLKEVIGSNIN